MNRLKRLISVLQSKKVQPFENYSAIAVDQLAKQIAVGKATKQAFKAKSIELLNKNATEREYVRGCHPIFYGQVWSWPVGQNYLANQGAEPDLAELFALMYSFLLNYSYQLERRDQIRETLAGKRGHSITVWTNQDRPPCGMQDEEFLTPTSKLLEKIPPCGALNCRCRWATVYPKRSNP